ncbi:MAG: Orotidine 5'-phosphate decarboxylase [Candidatus Thorarchaeota archaeon]|nr:MAG: Orotidine 5'-phosphate decarboxylase [Candidatus Thorarchaeota archaeon]
MTYKRKLNAASFVRKTKLIVGLDIPAEMAGKTIDARAAERERVEKEAMRIIEATADYAVAYKFNRQLVLPIGVFDGVPRLIDAIHDLGLTAIMDCKINDVGSTNHHIARYYFDAGFDAVIANPLVGMEGGLDSVFKLAKNREKGVITLCYMSHPAAHEGYGLQVATDEKMKQHEPLYVSFAKKAKLWETDGVIVGATYPEKIREIKRILGDTVPIICPGVGAQGGTAKVAMEAGASYVIVARSICNADDPGMVAKEIAEETR